MKIVETIIGLIEQSIIPSSTEYLHKQFSPPIWPFIHEIIFIVNTIAIRKNG